MARQEMKTEEVTLRDLIAKQLAGWMDVTDYIYRDGNANPPLEYLYDPEDAPSLHKELARVVANYDLKYELGEGEPPELQVTFTDGRLVRIIPN